MSRLTDGNAGDGGGPAGVPEQSEVAKEPRVGVDEWVARVDERREAHRGLTGVVIRGWERVPPAGHLAILLGPVRDLPVLRERGQPLPLRPDHAHLRLARARTERRRRLRRAARSRVRRLLRLWRVRVRDHGQRPFGPPPAGRAGRPDRRRGYRAPRAPARAHVLAGLRRLPGDRDALLPAGLRDLRQQRERRPQRLVLSVRRQGRPDGWSERPRPDRPAQVLRLHHLDDEGVLLLHADLDRGPDDDALLRQRVADRSGLAGACARIRLPPR